MKYKIFLINLDKSTERLTWCRSELDKYGLEFERVPAVYGKDLTQQQLHEFYHINNNLNHYKKPLNIGEIGCYLSHINCWQKIVDEKLDYAVILEDDFKLSDSFQDFSEILTQLNNWDYIRLAFSTRNVPVIDRTAINVKYDLVQYEKVPINTLAQAVSYQGAKKLLASSKHIFRPVDVDLKHYWEKNIDILGIDPPLIKQKKNAPSEIDKIANRKGKTERNSIWRRITYQIGFKFNNWKYKKVKPDLKDFIK